MAKRKAPKALLMPEQLVIPAAENVLEVPSIYANTIELLSMNHIDVRMAFNEVIIETGNRPTVKRRANIVMPMQAFMLMLQALNANAQVLAASQQKQVEQAHAALQAQIEEAMGKQQPK